MRNAAYRTCIDYEHRQDAAKVLKKVKHLINWIFNWFGRNIGFKLAERNIDRAPIARPLLAL